MPLDNCDNCGAISADCTVCQYCQWSVCDRCDHTCKLENCQHPTVRVEEWDDVDDEGFTHFEAIICCDCEQELKEDRHGDLVLRYRRAA